VAWILIVFLILLGGLIAPFGDLLGTKIGKARFSILKLRPKKTATIVTIITGGFISAISIGLLILVSEEFRQRLFVDIPFLQKTLDESKKALIPLQEEQKTLEGKIIQKESLNKEDTFKFCKSLKYFSLAESLGGVESLICHPATMTHASVDDKTKNLLGIDDTLVRLSIGCEDTNDLISDILLALNKF